MKKLLVGLLSPFTFSLNDALVIMATGASLIFPNLCLAQYNIIYNFPATTVNGETPYGSLTRVGPVLYGMTEYGGAKGVGSILAWIRTVTALLIYSISILPTGSIPKARW